VISHVKFFGRVDADSEWLGVQPVGVSRPAASGFDRWATDSGRERILLPLIWAHRSCRGVC